MCPPCIPQPSSVLHPGKSEVSSLHHQQCSASAREGPGSTDSPGSMAWAGVHRSPAVWRARQADKQVRYRSTRRTRLCRIRSVNGEPYGQFSHATCMLVGLLEAWRNLLPFHVSRSSWSLLSVGNTKLIDLSASPIARRVDARPATAREPLWALYLATRWFVLTFYSPRGQPLHKFLHFVKQPYLVVCECANLCAKSPERQISAKSPTTHGPDTRSRAVELEGATHTRG